VLIIILILILIVKTHYKSIILINYCDFFTKSPVNGSGGPAADVAPGGADGATPAVMMRCSVDVDD